MWTIVVVAGLLLFAYPFGLYPALLDLFASWPEAPAETDGDRPMAALVVCALNEEKIIRQKLENSLALRYPSGKLRLVFISDGSTDATAEIIREFVPAGVELIDRKQRQGKTANLNQTLAARSEEILILSDANVLYHEDALMHLTAPFRDPRVGGVSGKVILTDNPAALDAATGQYYSIEWTLQQKASAIYSMVGTDGAMYALRRKLFRPCPDDTIIEDFVIAMEIVRQGYRMLFEPRAFAWERGPASLREEFRRKVRIAAGAAQALIRGNAWPWGAPARYWFIFVSHKLLRWLSPLIGAVVLLVALLTLGSLLSQGVLAGFLTLCGLALAHWITGWNNTLVTAPFYFVFGQVAMAWGLAKGIAGQQNVMWAKANR